MIRSINEPKTEDGEEALLRGLTNIIEESTDVIDPPWAAEKQDHTEKRILKLRAGHKDVSKHSKYQRTHKTMKTLANDYRN
ncbi:Hypothetical predicted protein [Octopus vulgaris]|uniref:Uncharacterized protein n=1 Tax=Octopus vulgaris TaxID=6645 RepID=A0AA36FDT5_OCTVU|nr:Hypothetical predicted protein [Octopus vulgaris]